MTQPLEADRSRIQYETAQWESYGSILLDHGVPFTAITDIQLAYNFAQEAHRGQLRASGEPYFSHPRAVSLILLEAGITDPDLHIVALLHDVPEDNPDYISRTTDKLPYEPTDNWDRLGTVFFDQKVTDMVDALTEPSKDEYDYETDKKIAKGQLYHEQLEHALFALPGAILVKMADRLHNLRTLGAMPIEKQRNKIRETETMYYPLFERATRGYPQYARYLFGEIKKVIAELKQ